MPSAHLLCLLAVVVCVGLASYGAQERGDYARRTRRSRRRDDAVAVVPDAADGDPALSARSSGGTEAARLEHGGYDGHAAGVVLGSMQDAAEDAADAIMDLLHSRSGFVPAYLLDTVQAARTVAAELAEPLRRAWTAEEAKRSAASLADGAER